MTDEHPLMRNSTRLKSTNVKILHEEAKITLKTSQANTHFFQKLRKKVEILILIA